MPVWDAALVGPEQREKIRDALREGSPTLVRVPVTITEKNKSGHDSYFEALWIAGRRESGSARSSCAKASSCRRRGHRGALPGVRSIVVIREGGLADLLGDAEGPAHTSWNGKTERFHQRYIYGPQWLTFVKQAPKKLLEIVEAVTRKRTEPASPLIFF